MSSVLHFGKCLNCSTKLLKYYEKIYAITQYTNVCVSENFKYF